MKSSHNFLNTLNRENSFYEKLHNDVYYMENKNKVLLIFHFVSGIMVVNKVHVTVILGKTFFSIIIFDTMKFLLVLQVEAGKSLIKKPHSTRQLQPG